MISKRICSSCRATATIREDNNQLTAIAWHCAVCKRGSCRHVVAYPVKIDGKRTLHCADCFSAHLDAQAIERGSAA